MKKHKEFLNEIDKEYGDLLAKLHDIPLTWERIDDLKKQGVNILILPIKKEWYDGIKSGFKKEEYRGIKPHYNSRLMKKGTDQFKEFDLVVFTNGYGRKVPHMVVKLEGIRFGVGREKWGAAKDTVYYVLELGQKIWNSKELICKRL